eukprot:49379_1
MFKRDLIQQIEYIMCVVCDDSVLMDLAYISCAIRLAKREIDFVDDLVKICAALSGYYYSHGFDSTLVHSHRGFVDGSHGFVDYYSRGFVDDSHGFVHYYSHGFGGTLVLHSPIGLSVGILRISDP